MAKPAFKLVRELEFPNHSRVQNPISARTKDWSCQIYHLVGSGCPHPEPKMVRG